VGEWNGKAGMLETAAELVAQVATAVERTPLVAVCALDQDGQVRFWNSACAELYGIAPAAALQRPYVSLVWPLERAEEYHAALADVWRSGQPATLGDWHVQSAGGRQLWIYAALFPVYQYGVLRQVWRMEIDVSERLREQRALQLAAQVFETARDAIVLTDHQQLIVAVNRACIQVTGYADGDLLGQPLGALHGAPDDAERYRLISGVIAEDGHWQGEIAALRKNGERYPAWMSLRAVRDASNAIRHYVLVLSDISERKRMEASTRHQAEHDFLTDLPNRVLLQDRLSLALAAARRKDSMLAVLFLDLDHFKQINDTLGHPVGDLLLKEVAARLLRCVRGVDTVSRQGGDEFVILLAEIGGIEQAAHVAGTILQAVGQEYVLGPHRLSVSVSVGISLYPSDGADYDTLLNHADLAMYHAKDGGRSRFQFFNPEMHARAQERVSVENELRQALKERQFQLEFYPAIDLASGSTVGAEALVRWRHPTRGLLYPERFMAAAEDSGLIVPLGCWVLQQACRAARRWDQAQRPMPVAVNLSAVQFMQKDLARQVEAELAAQALAPAQLELEMTEATLMRHGAAARETLAALSGLGVRLAIDHFGTGYSRLGQLKDYPVDKLKIDRSFLAGLERDGSENARVVRAIIGVGHGLGMRVVAEGVESDAQRDFLSRYGCDEYQGLRGFEAADDDGMDGLLASVRG